jgi:putative lipoic acid-binding regulatory protein
MASSPAATLLVFPTPFPLKIMGRHDEKLERLVLEIVCRHDPAFDPATLERRASSGGNYLSLTCTVTATSQIMLDDLYRELTALPLIRFVL